MNKIGLKCLSAVTEYNGISLPMMLRRTRRLEVVRARQQACWMLRKHARMSYPEIGRALGLHHATVMYHFQMVEYAADPVAIAEREEVNEYYRVLAKIEYDKEIPF